MRLDCFRVAFDALVEALGVHAVAGAIDGDAVKVPVHARDGAGGIVAEALERLDSFE